jgi:putative Mn2+ efflux pump MntP
MIIFHNYTFTWWQMGLFKVCLLALGILIGSQCAERFQDFVPQLAGIVGILGVYLAYVAWK